MLFLFLRWCISLNLPNEFGSFFLISELELYNNASYNNIPELGRHGVKTVQYNSGNIFCKLVDPNPKLGKEQDSTARSLIFLNIAIYCINYFVKICNCNICR